MISLFFLGCLRIQFLVYILKVTIYFNKITDYRIENLEWTDDIFNAFHCTTLFLKFHFWSNARISEVSANMKFCKVVLMQKGDTEKICRFFKICCLNFQKRQNCVTFWKTNKNWILVLFSNCEKAQTVV